MVFLVERVPVRNVHVYWSHTVLPNLKPTVPIWWNEKHKGLELWLWALALWFFNNSTGGTVGLWFPYSLIFLITSFTDDSFICNLVNLLVFSCDLVTLSISLTLSLSTNNCLSLVFFQFIILLLNHYYLPITSTIIPYVIPEHKNAMNLQTKKLQLILSF